MRHPDKVFLGVNTRGLACYASPALIAEKGEIEVARMMDFEFRRYPVITDLSGNIVMVEGMSHEAAIARWLGGKK